MWASPWRLLAWSVVLVVAQASNPQAPVYRSTADMVPLFVTVADKNGRLVTDLTRDDFRVLDNGRPQALTLFDSTPQPVRLIVMLDVSGSMTGNLPILRAACDQLFGRLRPDDRVRVGTFGQTIEISPGFTGDVAAMRAALPTAIAPNAPTPLWRAIDQAIGEFGGETGRRVVLVLSDGKDAPAMSFGQKYIGQLDVTDRAEREDVMIYAVGLRSRSGRPMMPAGGQNLGAMMAEDLPDPGLGKVALDTGGGYIEIGPRDDLAAAFARVADELHSQYLLGFTPPARDGKSHGVDVRLDRSGLKPRARKNYLAPKSGSGRFESPAVFR
jgi:VWFA-related protein